MTVVIIVIGDGKIYSSRSQIRYEWKVWIENNLHSWSYPLTTLATNNTYKDRA